MGATTIGIIVDSVCSAIWKLLSPIYLPSPKKEDWIKIANDFNEIWNFPNCVGAIDGKHISIICPPGAGSEYYNYKGYHSIVLQAVVDAHAKFVVIDVGDYGRSSDSGIFKESLFGKKLINNKLNLPAPKKIDQNINEDFPFVFVGDEAYPLLPNLMRPFPRRQLTNEKRIYNYRLSRARRIVECAFGIMVKRFNVLENKMLVGPEKATKITRAICVLHNLIMTREVNLTEIHNEIENHHNQIEIRNEANIVHHNRSSVAAIEQRNKFMDFFNSENGSVPWQDRYLV